MIKNNEIEEIKQIIKKGFDLELISFELDIPIEELKKYKDEIERNNNLSKTKTHNEKEIIDKKNIKAHSNMQKMREKYNQIFFTDNKKEINLPNVSKQQIELINSVIKEIEKNIRELKSQPKAEIRKKVGTILTELNKIESYPLTVEQSEKLYILMKSKDLEKLNLKSTDKIDTYINKKRKMVIKKLAKSIDIAQSQTENLEELKNLQRKLTMEMAQKNPILVGSVISKIENKILKINQQKALYRIRNSISNDIEYIIKELANGTLDKEKAIKIIEEEARKRIESREKTKFSLTEEQEKKQIIIQIKTLLMENPQKYSIKNPEATIIQIQELCGGEQEQAIRTVVNNFIEIKNFEKAKEICNKYSNKDNRITFQKFIRSLRNQIKKAEIGDLVLKGLNVTGNEERIYFELIEKGLNTGNVKLNDIYLGKTQDGLRKIYLSDIWENQEKTI